MRVARFAEAGAFCDAVDRDVRGGGRGIDLATLHELGCRLYVTDEGYAFAGELGPLRPWIPHGALL